MKTTSFSDPRKHLAATLGSVTADHAPGLISRDRGKPAAVLMSVEDYAAYEETAYLLKSPGSAERLLEATRGLDRGAGLARDLIE